MQRKKSGEKAPKSTKRCQEKCNSYGDSFKSERPDSAAATTTFDGGYHPEVCFLLILIIVKLKKNWVSLNMFQMNSGNNSSMSSLNLEYVKFHIKWRVLFSFLCRSLPTAAVAVPNQMLAVPPVQAAVNEVDSERSGVPWWRRKDVVWYVNSKKLHFEFNFIGDSKRWGVDVRFSSWEFRLNCNRKTDLSNIFLMWILPLSRAFFLSYTIVFSSPCTYVYKVSISNKVFIEFWLPFCDFPIPDCWRDFWTSFKE